MEEKRHVTLEEMLKLYEEENKAFKKKTGNIPPCQRWEGDHYVEVPAYEVAMGFGSLLDKHIHVEKLLLEDYRKINWAKECGEPYSLIEYVKLWMNPLVWKNPWDYDDYIIDGRIAVEEYDDDREEIIENLVEYIYEQLIIDYADNAPVYKEDYLEEGYTKGMHEWGTLTWDVKSFIDNIIIGEPYNEEEIESKYYNFIRLRYNLTIIAKKRSGQRALELLCALQNEWPKIKQLKTWLKSMEEDAIIEFENQLFHGFDDLLEEWKGGSYNPTSLPPKKNYKALKVWLEYQKQNGKDYYAEANSNRSKMCINISKIVKWKVNENSLQKAQNRK